MLRVRLTPTLKCSAAAATKSPSADVLIFDYTKHPSKPAEKDRNVCRPNLRLKGHEAEGYGLAWSTMEPGKLVSGGDDNLVCYWDIAGHALYSASGSSSSSGAASSSSSSSSSPSGPTLAAERTFRGHTEVVEDVAFHRKHNSLFGSVGDDKMLMM
jgi:WD40 repeat protein